MIEGTADSSTSGVSSSTSNSGASLARAGAAACPNPVPKSAGVLDACSARLEDETELFAAGRASPSVFPAASAARRNAVAMGSAIGREPGCQGNCLGAAEVDAISADDFLPETGSGMDSSNAVSAGSSSGVGALSISNTDAEATGAAGVNGGAGTGGASSGRGVVVSFGVGGATGATGLFI